eukprot:6067657-Amphidinium_carterae.1
MASHVFSAWTSCRLRIYRVLVAMQLDPAPGGRSSAIDEMSAEAACMSSELIVHDESHARLMVLCVHSLWRHRTQESTRHAFAEAIDPGLNPTR